MARRLNAYVHVDGVAYGPDSEVPADVAKRIGAHAWADVGDQVVGEPGPESVGFDDPAAQQSPTPTGAGNGGGVEAPPRSGRGSGVEAWRQFAEQHDLDVPADATREEIIAAAEDAELIEREG